MLVPDCSPAVAALTAATTAASATATTATEATTTTAEATTAAAATRLARLGLVHAERAPIDERAVHALDRRRRLLISAHRDEREAARAARLAVHDDVNVGDLAAGREGLANAVARGVEGKVADVKTIAHVSLSLLFCGGSDPRRLAPTTCNPMSRRDRCRIATGIVAFTRCVVWGRSTRSRNTNFEKSGKLVNSNVS